MIEVRDLEATDGTVCQGCTVGTAFAVLEFSRGQRDVPIRVCRECLERLAERAVACLNGEA